MFPGVVWLAFCRNLHMINNAVLHLLLRELAENGENENRRMREDCVVCVCVCVCGVLKMKSFVHILAVRLHIHTFPQCKHMCLCIVSP